MIDIGDSEVTKMQIGESSVYEKPEWTPLNPKESPTQIFYRITDNQLTIRGTQITDGSPVPFSKTLNFPLPSEISKYDWKYKTAGGYATTDTSIPARCDFSIKNGNFNAAIQVVGGNTYHIGLFFTVIFTKEVTS